MPEPHRLFWVAPGDVRAWGEKVSNLLEPAFRLTTIDLEFCFSKREGWIEF